MIQIVEQRATGKYESKSKYSFGYSIYLGCCPRKVYSISEAEEAFINFGRMIVGSSFPCGDTLRTLSKY